MFFFKNECDEGGIESWENTQGSMRFLNYLPYILFDANNNERS
jgi:hypothetical protein